ncbi:MAG: hypothetical protein Q9227_002797 [Pyrenula ochraceoflavens]
MSQTRTTVYRTPPRALRPYTISPAPQDSPSRQLLGDLQVELQKLQLYEEEVHKVHLFERSAQKNLLDQHDTEVAQKQLAGLEAAVARNEAIRQGAEVELLRWKHQAEEEERKRREAEARRLREEEAKQEAERQRRAREEEEKRAREERARAEKARQEAEQKAKVEAEQKARLEAEEKIRQERETTAKREAEEKARAEQLKADQIKAEEAKAQAARATTLSSTSADSEKEQRHARYLEIHQNLKAFRKRFVAESKQNPNLKPKVGDIRRKMRQYVGQLVDMKIKQSLNPKELQEMTQGNMQVARTIEKLLKEAMSVPSTTVDIKDFIAFPPANIQSSQNTQVPALMIYALNLFSKRIVEQWATEAGTSTTRAEPVGVLAAKIFSSREFLFEGVSMVDILLAKLHLACPVLFGIYGRENTQQGRTRLGWRKQDGAFIKEKAHYERMAGLGAGFASISLRNFVKARPRPNPVPPPNFWSAVTGVLNVPLQEITVTHLVVLKALMEHSSERFIQFYDAAAVALLRAATVQWPTRLPAEMQKTPQCDALRLLPDKFQKDVHLTLT